jgi:DNA-binding NarL/FixJ family response regulator
MALRIIIADDHEIVRRGLRAVIDEQPSWSVVAEAANGREAVEFASDLRPQVVILDLHMPLMNGLEATRQIRATTPQIPVLVLTVQESEQTIREVLDAGAQGYLLKSDAGRDLQRAIEALASGRPFFTSTVARMVLNGYLTGVSPQLLPNGHLSPREREIVQMVAEGKTTKEVATELNISPATAETHRSNIMRKLNLRTVADLVRYAVRNQIVQV